MTDEELKLLASLVAKFKRTQPQFEVLITDANAEELGELMLNNHQHLFQLDAMIDMHFDNK